MRIALVYATNSTCSRHKVSAIFTDSEFRIIATGWNGVKSGEVHCDEIFLNGSKIHPESGMSHSEWSKLNEIHAEINAINQLIASNQTETVVNLFVTKSCCENCSQTIIEMINSGKLSSLKTVYFNEEWSNSLNDVKMFESIPVNKIHLPLN
jgi:dCMP deaminase